MKGGGLIKENLCGGRNGFSAFLCRGDRENIERGTVRARDRKEVNNKGWKNTCKMEEIVVKCISL